MGETIEKMKIDVQKAKQNGADLVEIRLDHLTTFNPSHDLHTLIQDRLLPVLITYRCVSADRSCALSDNWFYVIWWWALMIFCFCFLRPTWEGGKYDGDENKRLDALRLAMELGADYIDVELKVVLFSPFDFISWFTIPLH